MADGENVNNPALNVAAEVVNQREVFPAFSIAPHIRIGDMSMFPAFNETADAGLFLALYAMSIQRYFKGNKGMGVRDCFRI